VDSVVRVLPSDQPIEVCTSRIYKGPGAAQKAEFYMTTGGEPKSIGFAALPANSGSLLLASSSRPSLSTCREMAALETGA
jgi:hypothetical protein